MIVATVSSALALCCLCPIFFFLCWRLYKKRKARETLAKVLKWRRYARALIAPKKPFIMVRLPPPVLSPAPPKRPAPVLRGSIVKVRAQNWVVNNVAISPAPPEPTRPAPLLQEHIVKVRRMSQISSAFATPSGRNAPIWERERRGDEEERTARRAKEESRERKLTAKHKDAKEDTEDTLEFHKQARRRQRELEALRIARKKRMEGQEARANRNPHRRRTASVHPVPGPVTTDL